MFKDVISKYFGGLGVSLGKSFAKYTNGVASAVSFSTNEIARHVSRDTGHDVNTSAKGLNYLLENKNFQIDDHYWRHHINMVFDLMIGQKLLAHGETLHLQIDFTSHENYFLILAASIVVNNRSIPLYFTMRNYPQKKDQYNQKKMELAFIKGLKHVLSKKFKYIIVADRGFGNHRFCSILKDNGLDYILRINPNLKIRTAEKTGIMETLLETDGTYNAHLITQKTEQIVHKTTKNGETWFLMSNIEGITHEEAGVLYAERFKIEKCFQDLKSSGFNIEKTKIRKYAKFKKLLAMTMVAHVLIVVLGHIILTQKPQLKKNSP